MEQNTYFHVQGPFLLVSGAIPVVGDHSFVKSQATIAHLLGPARVYQARRR
jgi:hypothetical protein